MPEIETNPKLKKFYKHRPYDGTISDILDQLFSHGFDSIYG